MELRKSTKHAIAILIRMFSKEQQEGLKITLGDEEITLLEQFIGRGHNHVPKYDLSIFRIKAAHLISGNRYLFYRAIKFNSEEFQEELKAVVTDPNSYVQTKESQGEYGKEASGRSLGNNRQRALTRSMNKLRSGTAESGTEYADIDKGWEKDDMSFLKRGIESSNLSANIRTVSEGESKGKVGKLKLDLTYTKNASEEVFNDPMSHSSTDIVPQPSAPLSPDQIPDEEDASRQGQQEEYDIALQTITLTQGRDKSVVDSISELINFKQFDSNSDGKRTDRFMSKISALNAMTSTLVKDARETAFQKLDVLFKPLCQ